MDGHCSLVLAMDHGEWVVERLCKNSFKRGSGQVGSLLWDKELFRKVANAGLYKSWNIAEQNWARGHVSLCPGRMARS